MQEMNDIEENNMVEAYKAKLDNGKATKDDVIKGLKSFMGLWGENPTREFTVLKKYIEELNGKN